MRITDLAFDNWFPEHALVSSTRFIILFSLIQSISLNRINPAFHPMLVSLVLPGVVRDAENLFHPFEKAGLKRLTLISD